ncbi:hypothetical protein SAMN05216562_0370 [Microbulbifer marinus]|uniref:Uncharacterized protein n=1 Tax=Microbulbifer marinus TaxID=658218 RepID=A0A1H3VXS2_9GAMM|nr:hypothetical protein SAMN05216562_0370 [Microbulbifer marinus]
MIMLDRHVNLKGFLEGGPCYPMHWHSVLLNANLSQDEWRCIEYFQIRAREFLLNVEDLKLPGFFSLSIDHGGQKVTVESNAFPGRHRVKSLYLDFRHFIADKEPSKFQRTVNILSKNIDRSNPLQTFLSELKRNFLREASFGITANGRELSVARLVDLWFNTEFFHAGREEQEKERLEWLAVLHDDAAHQLLLWGVINTTHTVKSLYACVKDLCRTGSLSVNCPDPRIIFRDASN